MTNISLANTVPTFSITNTPPRKKIVHPSHERVPKYEMFVCVTIPVHNFHPSITFFLESFQPHTLEVLGIPGGPDGQFT